MKVSKNLSVIALLFQLFVCHAGEIKTENPSFKVKHNDALSEQFYESMLEYNDMISNKQYQDAKSGFHRLLKKGRINRFEKGMAEMYLGMIESTQGNHETAANHFKASLDTGSLRKQAFTGVSFKYAKSLIAAGKYEQSIQALNEFYIRTDTVQDYFLALEAVAQVKIEEYDKAIELYNKAIALSEEPQEKWNHHLYMIYVALKDEEKATEILDRLRIMNPTNQAYWKS